MSLLFVLQVLAVVVLCLTASCEAWTTSHRQVSSKHSLISPPKLHHSTKLFMSTVKDNLRRSLPQHPVIKKAMEDLKDVFEAIDIQTMTSLDLILRLYAEEKVDTLAFHGVNGYGYGDVGREKFDAIVAKLLGAEKALVRLQFFSGTHAISTALFACLRPNDEILCISGKPYDTLEEVLGLRSNSQCGNNKGSLKDWGIGYQEIDLLYHHPVKNTYLPKDDDQLAYSDAMFDLNHIAMILNSNEKVKLLHIQR